MATAAGLNMTEPAMTGIGGDMFCLFYNARTRKTHALNGSGRSPANVTLNSLRKELSVPDGEDADIPFVSVHAATVSGAAAGWVDTVEKFGSGKVSLEQVLAPAIELGEGGFPVSTISSAQVTRISNCSLRVDSLTLYSGGLASQFSDRLP